MHIKRLRIENFGSILYLEKELSPHYTLLKSNDPKAALTAVCLLLETAYPFSPRPSSLIREKTRLCAEVETKSGVFCVEKLQEEKGVLTTKVSPLGGCGDMTECYHTLMRRSREEEDVCFFDGAKKHPAPNKVLQYLYEDKYYLPGEFGKLTNGIGCTKTFRTFLKTYVEEKDLYSETNQRDEKKDPPFLNYIDTVRFWDCFSKIRDLNYEGKPLMIANPPSDPIDLLLSGVRIERQALVFSKAGKKAKDIQKKGGDQIESDSKRI